MDALTAEATVRVLSGIELTFPSGTAIDILALRYHELRCRVPMEAAA